MHSSPRTRASVLLVLALLALGLPLLRSAPVQAATTTLTFVASADSYVNSAKPQAKYGTAIRLRVSGSPARRTYLRFPVTGVTGTVTRATLTLRAAKTARLPVEVRKTSGTWTESTLAWANAPATGSLVGTAPGVTSDRLDVDVTAAVTGDGSVDLAVLPQASAASSTVLAEFYSREVANLRPTLTVQVSTPDPLPDTTPPAAPTDLTATAGDAAATLGWQPPPDPDLQGYRVYRRAPTAEWPTTPLAAPTAATWNDQPLVNGTAYEYQVTAVDTAGNESPPSGSVTVTPVAPVRPCDSTSGYSATVLGTAGLAAYWRLGELAGTTACEARRIAPGTYVGGLTLGRPGAVVGDPNTAVQLNGTTGHVKVPSKAALNVTAAMSVEAWVSPGGSTTSQTVIRKQNQYLLRLVGPKLIGRLWWSDGTTTEITAPSAMTAGATQHVAMTYDGTAIRLFRNGGQVASVPVAKTIATTTSTLYLGASGGTYDFLNGQLDEVALYGTALSPTTVAARYRTGAGLEGAGPAQLTAVGAPGAIGLRWPVVPDATEYRVFQRADDGSWPTSPIASTTDTSYVVTGLVDGQSSAFRVTAVVADTESTPSPPSEATPTSTVLLAAGDIADSTFRAEQTARLLDRTSGQVLVLGDAAYPNGTAEEYQTYYAPTWGRHLWRTRVAVGNHEYLTDQATPTWDYFGTAAGPRGLGYYSYDLGDWHVVVLNSNCGYVGGCGAGSPQEQWLRADLSGSTAACTVAVWHHPRFTSSATHSSSTTYVDFWRALTDHGVELVLSGHDHAYERFAPQLADGQADPLGVRQFVAGTGGRSLYTSLEPAPNSERRIDDTHGILRLDLGAGDYSWTFVPVDGRTATDSGTDTCH